LKNDKVLRDYIILDKELGKGSYSTVHIGIERTTGKKLACKIIGKAEKWNMKQDEHLQQEIVILKSLQHVSIRENFNVTSVVKYH
jgi:serine/threonine protein kinase